MSLFEVLIFNKYIKKNLVCINFYHTYKVLIELNILFGEVCFHFNRL